MRLILAIVAGMLLCSSVSATPLDSSISGVYLAPDRVCNLTAARHTGAWNGQPQAWWVAIDLQCLTFAGSYRATRNVLYVYTGCPSFGAGATIADYSAAPFEFTLEMVTGPFEQRSLPRCRSIIRSTCSLSATSITTACSI